MYHDISNSNANDTSVLIDKFIGQLKFMKSKNYETITLNKLTNQDIKNKFIITFDDGYENIYKLVLPELKRLNYVATCFFVTNSIGNFNTWDEKEINYKKKKIMNINQINEWLQSGNEIGSHTADHLNLTKIDNISLINQLTESKTYFKKVFGIDVVSFSYPFGQFNDDVINNVKNNYKFAVTTRRSRYNKKKHDALAIPRIPINRNTSLFKFFLKIETIYEDIKFRN